MIGLLQRVSSASVRVEDREVAAIDRGLLVLIGIQHDDTTRRADRLLERLLGYRVFPDAEGRMNRSVRDIQGGLLLVPQFTLVADTRKGMRASLGEAAEPALASTLFGHFVRTARQQWPSTAIGEFGADMQVSLVNDGPVTFWLETAAD